MIDTPSTIHMRTQEILKILLSVALIIHILSATAVFVFRPESISTVPDPLDYRLAAINMIEYHIFSLQPAGFHSPQLLRTPVYPALLAGTYLLDGETGFAMIILQSLLLISMGWLLFKILIKFRVPENVALVLTTFYLFEPLQWLYTLQTMTETLASFFVMLLLVGAFLGKGIHTLWRAALFGIVLGLLVFEKPSAVMWSPFLLVLILCASGTWRARFARVVVAGLFVILTLTPWLIRNYDLTGHLVLSSSSQDNFLYFAGTPATLPEAYYQPLTLNYYNGNHYNETWYAYTTQAYPALLAAEHSILAHSNYLSLVGRQIACAPSVWFGNIQLQNQESYGHEYSLIADFVLHPNPKRDAILNFIDTSVWTIALLLSLLGTVVLLRNPFTRWRFLPLLAILLATLFINFCASWVRVLLPVYPVIVIATGAGVTFLMQKRPRMKYKI